MALSPRQAIELFHLVFLRALVARGDDQARFILKGGANLRFYFGSVRYSENLDLDVVVMPRDILKNKVERLLQAPAIVSPLKVHGITIVDASAPKQTETTQRWKAGLRVEGLAATLRTKIEFSRRVAAEGQEFAAVGRELARTYGLPPFLATHYTAAAASVQKIHALAQRTEPQARDVFDLHHLFARPETAALRLNHEQMSAVPVAIDRALEISFDDYAAQVVAYLDPALAELFESRSAWNAMQEAVVSRLTEFR